MFSSLIITTTAIVANNGVNLSTGLDVVTTWRSGNIVGRINEVTLRRARLVLGWVTLFGG